MSREVPHAESVLLGLLLGALACAPEPPANVVLVSVDTLRADHVGLLGYPRATTPRIDSFFAAGTVFENAWSPAPCTLPSVAQVLHGVWQPGGARPSLADLLGRRGYQTAAFVSQHQFRPDWHRGGPGRELSAAVRHGFDVFDVQEADEVDGHGMTARTAREVSDRALAWLESEARPPFLLWLHFFDPHDPYEPPARFRHLDAGNRSTRSGDRRRQLMEERGRPELRWQEAGAVFDPEDVAHLVNLYDGEIRFTDTEIGRVLSALDARGWVEESVVVLLADHGEWLGEGDRWDHCQTLEEQEIRVPFFWRVGGGRLDERARVADPVSLLDLAPTLLALLELEPPAAGFDGIDLRQRQPRTVFADWRGLTAARRGKWRLLAGETPLMLDAPGGGLRGENRLGSGLPIEAELREELSDFRAAHPLAGQSRELLEGLRALGYVE